MRNHDEVHQPQDGNPIKMFSVISSSGEAVRKKNCQFIDGTVTSLSSVSRFMPSGADDDQQRQTRETERWTYTLALHQQ